MVRRAYSVMEEFMHDVNIISDFTVKRWITLIHTIDFLALFPDGICSGLYGVKSLESVFPLLYSVVHICVQYTAPFKVSFNTQFHSRYHSYGATSFHKKK